MMLIKEGQELALILLSKKCGARSRDERLFLVSQLLGRKVDTFNILSWNDWLRIRDFAYPRWPDDDWEVGDLFKQRAAIILREYREKVLGQLSLFGSVQSSADVVWEE